MRRLPVLAAVALAVVACLIVFGLFVLSRTPDAAGPSSSRSAVSGGGRALVPAGRSIGPAQPVAEPAAIRLSVPLVRPAVEQGPVPSTGAAPESSVHGEGLNAGVAEQLAYFKNAAIPAAERLGHIEELARRGDDLAMNILKALGDEDTYLNYEGVEALGKVKGRADVAEYLKGKLAAPDSRMLCAAVRSLAAIEGESAAPAIAGVLNANRTRPDGHHDNVCAACVESLAAIRAASVIPILKAEFEETVGVTLLHEYGSKLVKALRDIGDPAGRPILLAYVDRLVKEEQAMTDNPMGREYLRDKIREAHDAAAALGKTR
ncbi:MAG: hypothetical protein QME60_08075 [Verrucomicrobiota bacterium]|nr:hypothetical protein [Verrucomicrobiota bacterium]